MFGFVALILPIIILVQRSKTNHRRYAIFSITSLISCAVSLCLQIFELHHRVIISDWSALMDTSRAVAIVAGLLLSVTIILNIAILVTYPEKRHKDC